MKTLAASLSILTREGVMLYLLRGVAFTCIISVLGVIMGLIVGSLLALARTYCKKGPARILGWFATAYIELFRNTPYLLWIFICVVFCPCPGFFARKMFGLTSVEMKLLFKAALALILFNFRHRRDRPRRPERRLQGPVRGRLCTGLQHR